MARTGIHRTAGLLGIALLLPGIASGFISYGKTGGRSGAPGEGAAGRGRPGLAAEQVVYHDVNAVLLAEANTGQIGLDIFAGNGAGFFPKWTPNNYVYGTGTWVGGIWDREGDGKLDTVVVQSYDPVSGASEYREGRHTQNPSDPLARLFRSTDRGDLAVWPEEFRMMNLDPNDPAFEQLVPQILSDQDIVGIYTTVGKALLFHEPSPPLEIRQRGMAFGVGLASQAIFFVFDVENISGDVGPPIQIRDAWMGYASDTDIGDQFSDDRTSLIPQQITPEGDTVQVDMGFAWDDDFEETDFVTKPGFVGVALLQTPGNALDGLDNDGDGFVDESPMNGVDDDGDGEVDDQPDEVDQIGLTHYTFFNAPSIPGPREDPQSEVQAYQMMTCDPPTECVEATAKSDIRFLIDSGPFQILPGETHRLVIAFCFANTSDPSIQELPATGMPPRPDPNHPALAELLAVRRVVQGVYDLNFLHAVPPPPPNVTLIPGDGQVAVLWDGFPLRTPDGVYPEFVGIDSTYRQYDFQGFRVWRSRTGNFSRARDPRDPLNPVAQAENDSNPALDLTLLAQYDLADGITDEDGIVVRDSVVHPSGAVRVIEADTFRIGSDTGLRFSFIDRGDPGMPLVNGFRYYYAVTAYDYNSPLLPGSRLSSETPLSFPLSRSAIPRSEPSTFRPAVRSALRHVSPSGEPVDDTSLTVDTTVTIAEFREDSIVVKTVFHLPRGDSTVTTYKKSTVVTAIISAGGDTLKPAAILAPIATTIATNALVGSSFTPIQHDRIPTASHSLYIRDVARPAGMASEQIRVFYQVVDDATGRMITTSPGDTLSFFDFALDGSDQTFLVQVFDDSLAGGVQYENPVTFNTDIDDYQVALPADVVPIHVLTFDADGDSVYVGRVKVVAPGDVTPKEFVRASDIEIVWENLDSLVGPVSVTDLDNQVPVAFAKPETTIAGGDTTITAGKKGSNWGFVGRWGALLMDPFLPLPLSPRLQIYVSGVTLTITTPVAPNTGDRWIMRQSALEERPLDDIITGRDSVHVEMATESIDSVFIDRLITWRPIPARRPPVPGTRYRMDLQGGGPEVGRADLRRIRVVPNPYLGMARFEAGPEDRQLHFVNLPARCTIRVYTIAGNLVRVLEHGAEEGGTEVWDLRTREGLPLASGNYYYHVTTPEGQTHLGRFAVVR